MGKQAYLCVPFYITFLVCFVQVISHVKALNINVDRNSPINATEIVPVSPKRQRYFSWRNSNTTSEDETCTASYGMDHKAYANINILDLYEKLNFDNPADRGEWQLYWKIKVDHRKFDANNKLKVVVLPHSHCDPGWIITFEEYYDRTVKKILNTMLHNLDNDSSLKFIWAEISFFSLWWEELSNIDRLKVVKIVKNNQLEFVTGGWVMPDEANSHYYSILIQLFEGNQWLKHHLNYAPKNGWSIDPFGVSPTMAYLLKRAGFSNMLIQRTHYIIKKHLGNLRELEFAWRQDWDSVGTTDILTQLMPFDSYTTPATCGPNKKLCAEFDFKGYYYDIGNNDVESRSQSLLSQYQQKGMLFKTNNVVVPLGGDFAWVTQREWTGQIVNYRKIFDYVNSHPELNAELQFGTLDDYFSSVRSDLIRTQTTPSVLSGDFFTYAERDDRYWSGYYTSRPFHKAMDRQLISHLRAAHIVYTLMTAELSKRSPNAEENPFIRRLFRELRSARRTLSLFQHHDGITGTSKDRVMEDYASKLFEGLKSCNLVMQKSFQVLTHLKNPDFKLNEFNTAIDPNFNEDISSKFSFDFTPNLAKNHFHDLPKYNWIVLTDTNPQHLLTIFNPVAQPRIQIVTAHIHTTSPHNEFECYDLLGNQLDVEVLPVFESQTKISANTFQINFPVEVAPFAVKNVVIRQIDVTRSPFSRISTKAKVYFKNAPATVKSPFVGTEKFSIAYFNNFEEMQISNGYITVNFDNNGFAYAVTVDGVQHPFKIGMFKYGSDNGYGRNSGLYVFMPDGEAKAIPVKRPFIKMVEGRFESYVEVWLDQVRHRITLFNHPGFERYSIEVKNQVNIQHEQNYELMMRLHTAIQSGNTSYTDLNGFQMIKRKRLSKLPLSANYFPFPAATFIEDDNLRMTVLTRQPLGTSSLAPGQIEIMMDRKLSQDDQLGVGQGSGDSLEIVNSFKIMFEPVLCNDQRKENKSPMLSLAAHLTYHDLLHPFKTFKGESSIAARQPLDKISDYQPSPIKGMACDVQFVDAIPISHFVDKMDDESFLHSLHAAFLVHRVGFDGRFSKDILAGKCHTDEQLLGQIRFGDIFSNLLDVNMKQMSLNFLKDVTEFKRDDQIEMQVHEIYGFVGKFQDLNQSK